MPIKINAGRVAESVIATLIVYAIVHYVTKDRNP